MDSEMLSEKIKLAVDKFYSLNGTTFKEKKKSLNEFIKNLQSEFHKEEIQDFVNSLDTKTEYHHALRAEIIVRFQLECPIWDILKSGNEAVIGKILKNWVFFKNVFDNVTIDEFVDEVLPLMSHKTCMKVIRVMSKNIGNNEHFSDSYFYKLESTYGIRTAMMLLSTCSIGLIKEKCLQYGFKLPARSLLQIYKRDQTFLCYYFDLIHVKKRKIINFNNYIKVFKYIAQTDFLLFWQLYEKYHYCFKIGARRMKKILPNKEAVIRYGFKNDHIFYKKHILNITRRFGLHKEYLVTTYPDNLDDYVNCQLKNSSNSSVVYMPRAQVFPLLNELFREKYEEDLTDYLLSPIDGNYLQYVTVSERNFILDKFDEKEDWLYFYTTDKSIPIFKEKLKSANDFQTRKKLIGYLFKTCYVNNDEKALLNILKLLYSRYKNDTNGLLDLVCNITTWKNYSAFTEEHWEVIYNLVEYIRYSGLYINEKTVFEKHFMWLIDNNKSFSTVLDEYLKVQNENKSLHRCYCFDNSLKYMKIFIEEVHKRLDGKRDELHFDLLWIVVEFDKRFPKEIDMFDYTYILDLIISYPKCYQIDQIYYFIKHYNKDKSFNKYIKYFDSSYSVPTHILIYCIRNCPEELDHFANLPKKISAIKNKLHEILLCPYFVAKYSNVCKNRAMAELKNVCIEVDEFLLKILSYDKKFIEVIKDFEPPEDAKIEPQTDRNFVLKQQSVIKCIPNVHSPENIHLVQRFCKADYLKYTLCALYKIAYKTPQILVSEYLQNIYEAAVSVRKHALFLGRHLLPVNLYYDFLLSASDLEINMSMRNILLKKSLEYFIENYDTKFFNLFIQNLDKIDKNDRDLYDHLLNYEKIPADLIAKYVTAVYNSIVNNEDEEIRKKRFKLIESLPDYVIDDLEVEFMKLYLLDTSLGTTNFVNKCLFHTTGEKYDEMYVFIFNLIVDQLKICKPTNIDLRKRVSKSILSISRKAIKLKINKIVEHLYDICKINFPPHGFITTKIQLDFCMILLKTKMDLDLFSREINGHLIEFTKLYSANLASLYAKELQLFLVGRSIDQFHFIHKFFNANPAEDVCLVTIAFLPHSLPTKKNANAKFLPILDSLSKIEIPSVVAQLDVYFSTAY